MKISVEVGEEERSKLEFCRNWFTGAVQILIDGQTVATKSPASVFTHFSLPNAVHRWEFTVGTREKHHVLIEHIRPLFLAGFRPQTYRVTVDLKLQVEKRGY